MNPNALRLIEQDCDERDCVLERCSDTHFKIRGPNGIVVNYWPTAKGGAKAHLQGTNDKSVRVTLSQAIDMACGNRQRSEVAASAQAFSRPAQAPPQNYAGSLAEAVVDLIRCEHRPLHELPEDTAEATIRVLRILREMGMHPHEPPF